MRLRYTLDNTTEGEHVTTYSPKGWEEMELVLKRHDKYDGIFKDFTTKLDFFCGAGKEYIDNIYDTQGIEAEVTVLIEIDCDDSGTFDTLYEGKLIMKSYEKVQAAPEYTRVNLEQSGIIQTVLNRLETKINLNSTETLDGDSVTPFTLGPYELTMHSKAIVLQGRLINSLDTLNVTASNNHNIGLAIEIQEIDTLLNTSSTIPDPFFVNGDSFSRDVNINGRIRLSVQQTSTIDEGGTPVVYNYSGGFQVSLIIYNELNAFVSGTPIHIEPVQLTSDPVTFDFTFNQDLTVPAGYGVGVIYSNTYEATLTSIPGYFVISRNQNYQYFDETYAEIYEESETASSTANVFPVFEAGADIARKITGQNDSFRSNYFGRKNSEPFAYNENGCGSFEAITNGFQIRGFPLTGDSGKPIILSMKDYFEGLSAIHCLGLGVKESGGNTYLEVEQKDYFYTDESVISLSYISNLKTKVDPGILYSRINVGYSEWRREGLNGLDEFCTTHNYTTKHKAISNELNAVSNFIAGPYAIERQRRLIYTENPSEDGEYDDNNFVICLNRSVDGSGIPNNLDEAEKDENFTGFTNIFSAETIYNARISPARNLRNWLKIIGTGLIKSNLMLKDIKFSFAEGNYKMTSQGTDSCDPAQQVLIGEGDDIELLIPNPSTEFEPFFTGDVDEFETHFSKSQYDELKSLDDDGKPNYFKKIRYSTTNEDFLAGYILELRYRPVKGTASFRIARAYERTEECTHIYVEEGYVECDYVE